MLSPLANAALRDDRLPAVELLLGSGVPDAVRAAAATIDADVVDAVTDHVTWWPGRSITVRFRVTFAGAGVDGTHELVATAGRIPDGAMVLENGATRIGVWRMPADPALPGLAAALDPERARSLLADLGAREDAVATRLRAYRPASRAVVEVKGSRARAFLKLVPPTEVERLHRNHELLAEHLPVPRTLGFDRDLGVLALQALPGATLRRALDDDGAPLPGPGDLDALLAALPPPAGDLEARSPIDRMRRLAELLSALLPDHADLIADVTGEVGRDRSPRSVPSHGDFYEAQLLVSGGAVVGMLDIDTFGWGRPGDDPATMLGHLDVRRAGAGNPGRTNDYAAALLAHWDRRFDPVDLRRRTAAVVLGLATGPFRVQRADWPQATLARVRMAARWVESARRVGERHLIDASASSHPSVAT